MFPYFPEPVLWVGPVSFYGSELLLAAAVLVALWMILRRAARFGLRRSLAVRLYLCMMVCGWACGHLVKLAVYEPGPLVENLVFAFTHFRGLASFGGIFGGLLGAIVWIRWTRLPVRTAIQYIDLFAYTFPFAWIFGRASCALVHDHPGIPAANWLAVRFPGGPRYDLGLIEFFYAILLAALFLFLDRRPRPAGFFFATLMLLYGPFRHALDSLHVRTPEFLGTSPDRFFGIVAVALGLAMLLWLKRSTAAKPALPSNTAYSA